MYSNVFNTISTSTLAHSFKIMAHNYKKKYMQFNQTSAFRGTSEHTKVDKLETGNILNFFFTWWTKIEYHKYQWNCKR